MQSEERRRAEGRIELGLFLFMLGLLLIWFVHSEVGELMFPVVQGIVFVVALASPIIGTFYWFYGCWSYARAKGYSPILGALGLLSVIGLLILVALPEHQTKVPETQQSGTSIMQSKEKRGAEGRIELGIFLFMLGLLLIWIVPAMARSMSLGVQGVLSLLALASPVIGIVYWFYGCWSYARAKGYSPVLGALGLLSLIGLLILVALPEQQSKVPETQQPANL